MYEQSNIDRTYSDREIERDRKRETERLKSQIEIEWYKKIEICRDKQRAKDRNREKIQRENKKE